MSAAPVLEVDGLVKHFPVLRGVLRRAVAHVKAVDGVSFSIQPGETLCLVGESGCGKSTVARLILRLVEPTSGSITIGGTDVTKLSESEMRPHRRRVQMVFQDPYASLNPRMASGDIVAEPLENYSSLSGAERRERVTRLFERVGLRADALNRYPFEFSGGQRQRLGIARALALQPELIVADEPVSALDVSVQAQVLNLLLELQERLRLTFLFVAHDLSVVRHISDRVAVMYVGQIVELAPTKSIFERPRHPYTAALLKAVPVADPRVPAGDVLLKGEVPSPANPPAGCYFNPRCPFADERCRREAPVLRELASGHSVRCHHAERLQLAVPQERIDEAGRSG